MPDEERRVDMQKIATDIALIKQALKTNNEQTDKVCKLLLGNGEVEGVMTSIAVLKSAIFRLWFAVAFAFTLVGGVITKHFIG